MPDRYDRTDWRDRDPRDREDYRERDARYVTRADDPLEDYGLRILRCRRWPHRESREKQRTTKNP